VSMSAGAGGPLTLDRLHEVPRCLDDAVGLRPRRAAQVAVRGGLSRPISQPLTYPSLSA
jgi:hypothetical protein